MEMQLVGPKGSDMKTFSNLKDSREKVDVPILEDLDLTGGVMEIDLGSWTVPRSLARLESLKPASSKRPRCHWMQATIGCSRSDCPCQACESTCFANCGWCDPQHHALCFYTFASRLSRWISQSLPAMDCFLTNMQ